MKIVYCIHSVYNPGGMERVLLNKVRWFRENTDWEILVVTTDQNNRPPFYPFPDNVRFIDLDINYSADNGLSPLKKISGYLRRRKLHRKRLAELLDDERPDFTISLYPCESSFIPSLKDGSRKILELHQSKLFRFQYARKGLLGLTDKWRSRQDERIVRRFDKFIVLTEEDRGMWGDIPNIDVIPNAARAISDSTSDCSSKRVIAVGRLDYQKGFDRLIEAWKIVQRSGKFADWRLDIFGQGEWKEMLEKMIVERGLNRTAFINNPVSDIASEYLRSSILVMSSHYEGFPMVMIEGMSAGLPAVSFDCKCGPRDIIDDGVNGLIVKEGDIDALASALMRLMADDRLRKAMGKEAVKVTDRYSEESVMAKWKQIFSDK